MTHQEIKFPFKTWLIIIFMLWIAYGVLLGLAYLHDKEQDERLQYGMEIRLKNQAQLAYLEKKLIECGCLPKDAKNGTNTVIPK